jgi:hypothetical protein
MMMMIIIIIIVIIIFIIIIIKCIFCAVSVIGLLAVDAAHRNKELN